MKQNHAPLVVILALLVAILACGAPGVDPPPNETVQALSQSLNQTATAAAAPTNTPAPDATVPEGDPQAAVSTAQALATQLSQNARATTQAQATTQTGEQAATEEAFAPIRQENQSYGIDTTQGRLAWTHPPPTLFVEGYQQFDYDVEYVTVAGDFLVAADITWNTQFGSTGCGFVVRSDADEEAGDRYFIIGSRGGSGRVLFGVQLDGNLVLDDSVDIYAQGIDPLFQWQNDTTNRIIVIGRGNTFSIYSNGSHLGDITPASVNFERGFVAFVALNESGTTTCTFTNAYLWLMN
jgi:hypothetical protein